MSEVSNAAYRYALGIYSLIAGFAWYFFNSLGLFLGQHVLPQSASGFSVANSQFDRLNNATSALFTLLVVVGLFLNQSLKQYVVDVGDELTRVSWAELKETQRSTLLVLGTVIVSAIFLFAADLVFIKIVNFILGTAV